MNALFAPTALLTIGLTACAFGLDRRRPVDGGSPRDLAVDRAGDLAADRDPRQDLSLPNDLQRHDLDLQRDLDPHDAAPDAATPDAPSSPVLTFGGSHTEQQCTAAGGTVFSAPGGTLCRLAAGDCPGGWSQAAAWQRYDPASWGGDHCGSWKSTGPATFANEAASRYGHGTWQGCADSYPCPHADWIETATTACGTKLHRGPVEGPRAAGSENRVEIGCI